MHVQYLVLLRKTSRRPLFLTAVPCLYCFVQVRAEERSAAKAALNQAIERTKQQLGANYGQEVQQQQQVGSAAGSNSSSTAGAS